MSLVGALQNPAESGDVGQSAAVRMSPEATDSERSRPIDVQQLRAAIERVGRGCTRRIELAVESGRVTLKGQVGSYFQKQQAQHAVMQIEGVELVVNQLVVE
jgi:osmotically-inducible protein OsmY